MSDLLLEVDEAMRWERMEKLWKAYGNYVLAFVALTILFTAGKEIYNAWDYSVKTAGSDRSMTMIQDKDYPTNVKAANLDNMRASLRGVALVMAAGDFMAKDKKPEALALYTRASNDSSIKPEIRDLAILMRARLISADVNSKENILDTLQPIINDAKSPWKPYAILEAANYAANRDHDIAKAHDFLGLIINNQAMPATIQDKARSLDQLYALKQKTAGAK